MSEDFAVCQAVAYYVFHERPAYQDGAVTLGQYQGAPLVDLEITVIAHEPVHLDGAEQHPGKAAVAIFQPARDWDDKVTGGAAAHH
ncbi:hypothetical protein D3C75_1201130 [compost metagenome]